MTGAGWRSREHLDVGPRGIGIGRRTRELRRSRCGSEREGVGARGLDAAAASARAAERVADRARDVQREAPADLDAHAHVAATDEAAAIRVLGLESDLEIDRDDPEQIDHANEAQHEYDRELAGV